MVLKMEEDLKSALNLLQNIDQRLNVIEERLKVTSTDSVSVTPATARAASAREYILKYTPSDDNQRALVLGAYIEEKGKESFTVEDLRSVFREARLKLPANMNDKVNKNIAKGYLMDGDTVDGKKSWMLTMTGQMFIANGLTEDGKNE